MSFQWIVDNAETLSINRLDTVGSTQARDGTVKAVNRGTPKKTFTVKLPDGPRWSQIRNNIIAAEALDKHTTDNISILYTKFPWYYGDVILALLKKIILLFVFNSLNGLYLQGTK